MTYHVCVDARLYFSAGIGTYLRTALKALASHFRLTLLCNENDKAELSLLFPHPLVMKSKIYTLKEQIEYVQKIPSCDLFWAPHFNVPLLPIRAAKRLTTICDMYHLAHFKSLAAAQKVYAKLLYNAAFFLSDNIVTISEFSKKEILKLATIKPKKLEIVSPLLEISSSCNNAVKQDFILYVGNLKPHKNLVRLVRAYAQVRPSQPLYIVGKSEGLITVDKQLFQEVERDAFLKKNVHFLGFVSEGRLKELYAQARVFIFPSTYEGFGYPPLEAMAYGCPVVASKTASIPEICEDAVEYVDPFSIDSIAGGIKRLLNDKSRRDELVQKGKELIEKKSKQKNRIVEVIDACCSSA